jgi:hypothetical protein
MQSDAEEEYQETLLKALAPLAAIDPRVDPQSVFETVRELPAERVGRAA